MFFKVLSKSLLMGSIPFLLGWILPHMGFSDLVVGFSCVFSFLFTTHYLTYGIGFNIGQMKLLKNLCSGYTNGD